MSFTLLLFSCATKKDTIKEFETAPLFGMVYDYDNKPCSDAKVLIDGKEGPFTDINGRFVVQSLSRGKHSIIIKKEQYEDALVSFNFLNKSQVLYVRMISFDQLLKETEKAIAIGKWKEVESLFERAEKIKKDDPVAEYLKAIYFKEKGEIEKAEDILLEIIGKGHKLPYVYLSLADIYQYYLDDPTKAAENLEQYLKLEANHEVQKRLDLLNKELQS